MYKVRTSNGRGSTTLITTDFQTSTQGEVGGRVITGPTALSGTGSSVAEDPPWMWGTDEGTPSTLLLFPRRGGFSKGHFSQLRKQYSQGVRSKKKMS